MANANARFLLTADDRASKVLRAVKQEVSSLGTSVKQFAIGFGAAFSGVQITRGLIDVAVTTDKLRASLETVTGSAAAANAAFDQIKTFTTSTPFQINEVADAFIKLSSLGIEPTEDLLRSLGNTASALGKNLDEAVEALADAVTGEFERLKGFGIQASKSGDEVSFTFRGVTTVVQNSSREIQRYLQNIGETDFAGATERQANTLAGAFSNLEDAVFNFADFIGRESGFIGAVKTAAIELTELTVDVEKFFRVLYQSGVSTPVEALGLSGLEKEAKQLQEDFKEVNLAIEERLRLQEKLGREPRTGEIISERLFKGEISSLTDLAEASGAGSLDLDALERRRDAIAGKFNEVIQLIQTKNAEVQEDLNSGGSGGDSAAARRAAAKAARDAARAEKEYRAELQNLLDTLDPATAETRAYVESVQLLTRARDEGDIGLQRYQELITALTTDTEALRLEEERLQSQRDRAMGIIKQFDELSGLTDQLAEIEELTTSFERLIEELSSQEQTAAVTAQIAQYEDLIDLLKEASLELGDLGDEGEEAAEKAGKAWAEFGPIVSSALEDAIIAGKSLSDVLEGLEQDILRLITRRLVTKPIEEATNSILDSFLSSSGTSGGGGSFFSNLLKFQTGGEFTVGGSGGADSQLVAFRATPGEQVTVTPPGSKSVKVVQNFNFPSAEAGTFRRNQQQIARAAREALNS